MVFGTHDVGRASVLPCTGGHLLEFLKAWLPDGRFSTDVGKHLAMTDNEVNAAMMAAAYDPKLPGHRHARAVFCRDHFRLVYERNPDFSQSRRIPVVK